jgi:aerobic carbon-monoxide dehydrogenase small subunit
VSEHDVRLNVNGVARRGRAEARTTLADFLRESLGLTGTHLACEHGVCGACTVMVDGRAVRSCLIFAVQADGADVTTVEGIAAHGLQCGFCTPGFVVSVTAFLEQNSTPDDAEIREALAGNLCRCTGYQGIVEAVKLAAARMANEVPA